MRAIDLAVGIGIMSDGSYWLSVTADQWIPLVEVREAALNTYLNCKRKEGYSILGLEQTANSVSIENFVFPDKAVRFFCCDVLTIDSSTLYFPCTKGRLVPLDLCFVILPNRVLTRTLSGFCTRFWFWDENRMEYLLTSFKPLTHAWRSRSSESFAPLMSMSVEQ